MTILEALTIIFKHARRITVIFVSVVTVATAVTVMQKPLYEAKSSLLVKVSKEVTSRPGMSTDNGSFSLSLNQEELINTEIQILSSREVAEKVITTIGLSKMYPAISSNGIEKTRMHYALQAFTETLKVAGVRKSNVITVSFRHEDPEIAAKVVNLVVDIFTDKHVALHNDPQTSFTQAQLAAFRAKLDTSERNLQEYQARKNIFSLDVQRSLLLKQKSDFNSAYKIAYDTVRELQKKTSSLRSQMKGMATSDTRHTNTDRDKIIADAKSRLLELQLKEHELRRKYRDTNRLVADARVEIEAVNTFLKEQEDDISRKVKTANPVYQNMEIDLFRAEADLKSQAAKAEALQVQIKQLDSELASLDGSERTIQTLKREVAINEKNYRAYADKHEEARISDAMNMHRLSNISVIASAEIPVKPVKPEKKLNIFVGSLFGVIAALGWAFVVEAIGATFSDAEKVEKYLQVQVLVTVPCKS